MIHLQIHEDYHSEIDPDLINRVILKSLNHLSVEGEAELTVVIDKDTLLHTLNLQHLGLDNTTDVLSFPSDETDPDSHLPYLGDIVISFERVLVQSEASGHTPEAELSLLLVHACLHLLGYDHSETENKRQMWQQQQLIVEQLNMNVNLPD